MYTKKNNLLKNLSELKINSSYLINYLNSYFDAIITLIGLPTEPNIFPFISSNAKAASDVFENLMYVTPT